MSPQPVRSRRPAFPISMALTLAFGLAWTSRPLQAQPAKAQGPAPATLPKMATEVAFPNLTFDRPLALESPGDGSDRLFVVEQHQARIWSFPNDRETSDKALFLQLPDPINKGNEEGLLGLAFHPKYSENGQFFVYYSANDSTRGGFTRRSVVSRFRVSKDNPRQADPTSEERIWVSADDPYENHNGGCIAFGPDGFLYISLGDGGAADDPLTTGQNPRDWFGSILRIDVDHPADGRPYGIPADNPSRRSKAHAHWAPEVFCIGLRNVWRFSFDRETGTLWAGDVGQNLWEMVHILRNGGNHGWSLREAFHPFPPRLRQKADPAGKLIPPVVEYPHKPTRNRTDTGLSITGGYTYRGKALKELVGVHIYADYDSGRIWGLREKDGKAVENGELIDLTRQKKLNISSFGEDAAGELYILAFDGRIHRLVPGR